MADAHDHGTRPTSLLDHPSDAATGNCLGLAAARARDGADAIVFLTGAAGSGNVGHVILQDLDTGLVREAEADPAGGVTLASYLGGDGRRVLAAVAARQVRGLLALETAARTAALSRLGAPVAGIAHLAFGMLIPPPIIPPRDTPPAGPVGASVQDTAVHAWLDALGNSVSDDEKKQLAQQGDDATTLLKWFNDHDRGDPKLNDMPQNIADAEDRLLADPDVSKKIHVGDLVTRDALKSFVGDIDKSARSMERDKSTPVGTPVQDGAVHDYVDSLGDAVSATDKTQLVQTADDTRTLLNWFNAHDRGDPALNDMPKAVAEADGRLQSDDAVLKRITVDGKVTRDALGSFLGDLESSAKSAKDSWNAFKKSDASPDPIAKQMAVDASLLQANEPILDAAGSDAAKVDGLFNTDDLKAIASTDLPQLTIYKRGEPQTIGGAGTQLGSNAHLPSALANAAALYGQPGMFSNLDTGGIDLATNNPDGLADGGNVGAWLSKQVPSISEANIGGLLNDAAARSMVAGVDTSKLGPDVFANPQNYSGAQKAAVMQELSDTSLKVKAGLNGSEWDGAVQNIDWGGKGNVNPDSNQVLGDISGKIQQLAADPDVQKFTADHRADALTSIVDADPALKSSLQSFYDGDLQNGKALANALGEKDANGNTVTPEQGLGDFLSTANTLTVALGRPQQAGSDGSTGAGLDFQAIAEKSGQLDTLKKAYSDDILTGNALQDSFDSGLDMGSSIQAFTADAANLGAVLPTDFVAQNAQKLQTTLSDKVSDEMMNTATVADLDAAFADANGNFDAAKLTDALDQAIAADPSVATDSNGNKIKPDQIVAAVGTVFADVRNGVKVSDALAKLSKLQADTTNTALQNQLGPMWKQLVDPSKPNILPPKGVAADAYNKGFLHIVGAVMNTGVLIGKGIEGGGNASGSARASQLSSGLQVVGGLLEGGSKYAKSAGITTFSSSQLKFIESGGKLLGGVGGIIGGAVGLFGGAQALAAGDKAGGGVSIAGGITGVWSGASSAIEGGLGIAETALAGTEFGEAIAAAIPAVAATSATLGLIAGGVAVLGLFGLGIYEAVEGMKRVDTFTDQIKPELAKYGITGGSEESTNPPVTPEPPVEA